MYQVLSPANAADRGLFLAPAGLPAIHADSVARQRPESLWMLIDETGNVMGRCSLWWSTPPSFENHRLGLIGHYAARDARVAAQLLAFACDQLAAHECTLAVGPMDGNTWQPYRLLSERGTEPIFFLEPDNPDDWPAHFLANGFTVLAQYYSALNTALEQQDPRIPELAFRLAADGIVLRCLDLDHFEEELRGIHELSLASFAHNFLYTPIGQDDFVAQYGDIQPHVRAEIVLLAERQGRAVGYVFAIPDLLQARRGLTIDTVIIKTLAVHPDLGGSGLGTLLTARCQEAACKLGYSRAIHALMHETNKSRKISSHTAQPIRRYTLYARSLGKKRTVPPMEQHEHLRNSPATGP
jgi:GNAT superfamily N-acetyltransferase